MALKPGPCLSNRDLSGHFFQLFASPGRIDILSTGGQEEGRSGMVSLQERQGLEPGTVGGGGWPAVERERWAEVKHRGLWKRVKGSGLCFSDNEDLLDCFFFPLKNYFMVIVKYMCSPS